MRQDSNIFELIVAASHAITRIAEHNQHIIDEDLVHTGLYYSFTIKALRELAGILDIKLDVP
jgi:hypothetical protein